MQSRSELVAGQVRRRRNYRFNPFVRPGGEKKMFCG